MATEVKLSMTAPNFLALKAIVDHFAGNTTKAEFITILVSAGYHPNAFSDTNYDDQIRAISKQVLRAIMEVEHGK